MDRQSSAQRREQVDSRLGLGAARGIAQAARDATLGGLVTASVGGGGDSRRARKQGRR